MRVLLLNYEYPPLGGGAGNATYFLLKEFAKEPDLNIDLVTASVSRNRVEKISSSIAVHYLDIGKSDHIHYQSNAELLTYSARGYMYARRLKRANRYDGVHAFFGIPCGFMAMRLGLPYIVSLRGSDVPGYSKRYAWLDKWMFRDLSRSVWRRANEVVANSNGLRELALETTPSTRIQVIPNGVDTTVFRPGRQKKTKGTIRLISTGRLISRKGYDDLIRALAGQSQFRLTLVGDGVERRALESLSQELNVRVEFMGRKSKETVLSLLQDADVFVLPSQNEGMSNSLLEAMACGLPVLVTDAPGSQELVKDNGYVVKRGSPSALKEGLGQLEAHRDRLPQQGSASRRRALEMDWGLMASSYLALYRQMGGSENQSRQMGFPGI